MTPSLPILFGIPVSTADTGSGQNRHEDDDQSADFHLGFLLIKKDNA